eukprot:scaffold5138_cov251-Pinguiococcus_pyrenoidosus.AAC.4
MVYAEDLSILRVSPFPRSIQEGGPWSVQTDRQVASNHAQDRQATRRPDLALPRHVEESGLGSRSLPGELASHVSQRRFTVTPLEGVLLAQALPHPALLRPCLIALDLLALLAQHCRDARDAVLRQ